MELSAITEDVLSDDYEEGEILDEDSLYEDVSSLEFTDSDSEIKKSLNETVPKKLKKKKEHICKEESFCRQDRSAKHCYARLKNRRSSLDSTEKNKNNTVDIKLDDVKTLGRKQKPRLATKPTGKRLVKKDTFHTSQKNNRYKDLRSNRQSKNHDYQRNGYRKYRPPSPKHHPVANTKTSLLSRLKAVGSIQTKDDNLTQDGIDLNSKILSDIDHLTVDKKAEIAEELDEWNLRIVALKTAVMKKFSDKKKNGIIIKRNSDSVDDSIVEYALEEYIKDHFPEQTAKDVDYRQLKSTDIEIDTQPLLIDQTLNSCFIDEKDPIQFAETDIDCRAYSCYPFQNNVPNCEPISPIFSPVINEEAVVPGSSLPIQEIPLPCLKEINTNNRLINKKIRKKKNNLKRKLVKKKLNITDLENETQEEKELREIALSSVKVKKVSEGSLVEVNPQNNLLKTLHVDTTSNSIESKPISNNSSDPWDDVDEDILRAQLLSSISNKIPQTESLPEELQIKKPVLKINKENVQNISKDKQHERIYYNKHFLKKNSYQQIALPCVQKLIINVNDSDTTEDEEDKPIKTIPPDIAASIDQLLQEVRTQTEIEQGNAMIDLKKYDSQPKVKDVKLISPNDIEKNKETLKNQLSKKPDKAPQDIKHLPAWQQEEYVRLKKKLLEKELLWNKSVKPKEELKSPELDFNKKQIKRPLPSPQSEEKINIEDIETPPKKTCVKESWQYAKDFSDMTTVVDKLEKDLQEFRTLKRDSARMKKELALLQNRILKKRRIMVSEKEILEKKEKYIKSKMITEFPLRKNEAEDPEKQKGKELVYFKFKEISLKAQLACINLNKELKTVKSAKTPKKEPTSPPKKRMKISTDLRLTASKLKAKPSHPTEKNQKAVHSVSESGSLDPFTPLCPYDMAGVCNDMKCQFQHLRPT